MMLLRPTEILLEIYYWLDGQDIERAHTFRRRKSINSEVFLEWFPLSNNPSYQGKGVGVVQCGVSNPDCTNTLFENKEPIFTKPRISCRRSFFSDKRSVWIYLFGYIYLLRGSAQKFNICRYLYQTLHEKFQIPNMNLETSFFAPTILSWKNYW